jgi:hypothetical protein
MMKSPDPFRVIIAGGRDFDDYNLLSNSLNKILTNKLPNVMIISGMANGADQLGVLYASFMGLEFEPFPADWKNLGRGAGHIRNREMSVFADALIAFWDGISRGTANMISTMQKMGKPVRVIHY